MLSLLLSHLATQRKKSAHTSKKRNQKTSNPPSSHDGGRRSESGRAHSFFSFFNEISPPNASVSSTKKLSILEQKLSTHTCSSTNQKCGYEKSSGSQPKNVTSTNSTLNTMREETLGTLTLPYSEDELKGYVNFRTAGLAKKSCDWILRATRHCWDSTGGIISRDKMEQFRATILTKYKSEWSHCKTLAFARSFLKYLTKIRLDTRYYAFCIFLDRPKHVKARKAVTPRIVTKEDIENVLERIRAAEREGRISSYRALQCTAFVLFGAFTGQRSMATISRLGVGQFKTAAKMEKPVLQVLSHQDKIRMEHYPILFILKSLPSYHPC